uniref:LRRGT00157 n=1 Tax=Rattus norvegicus TaxID=10116 RepID=Q6QI51_RAT|nr:LRRGT00157 [Rattus norvegicus]
MKAHGLENDCTLNAIHCYVSREKCVCVLKQQDEFEVRAGLYAGYGLTVSCLRRF